MRERLQGSVRVAWCVGVALCLVASSLQAGSVFMKNGYIIHGPIKEVVEDAKTNALVAVVIAWDNGKVTLLSRFIDNVVFDPGEKEALAAQATEEARDKSENDDLVEREITLPALPVDPMVIFRQEQRRNVKPETEQPRTGSDGTAGVASLTERRKIFRGLYASLPEGWTLTELPNAWVIESPRDAATNTTARIAGTLFTQELTRRAQMAAAVEQVKKAYSEWTLVQEGPREMGLQEGYQIVSRGVHAGATYQIRQILAWVGKFTCLVSCVCGTESDAAQEIERCLQSFEFVASEMGE